MALLQPKISTRTHNPIERFYTEEIVIGLCGPIGVKLPEIATLIDHSLASYGYATTIIKMSKFIEERSSINSSLSGLEKKEALIFAGNELRKKFNRGSLLAEMAIEKIFENRLMDFPDGKFASRRKCVVIDSIKNLEEARLFKEVYGSSFYLVGAFSPHDTKIKNLIKGDKSLEASAENIIKDDLNQKGEFGQQVGKVFQSADYFFRLEGDNQAEEKVQRLIKLVLGAEIITPEPAEAAMYMAASAARNSACLSRQVGAAITKMDGTIISTGWNDVPRFGGGTYSFGSDDKRCFNDGRYCRNDQEKQLIIKEIVSDLMAAGVVDTNNQILAHATLANSRVSDLIEFSRAVHAEMHAILGAAKNGSGDLRGAILYCTTYPCHSCARHIVAAGISEVFFIEPYAKSKALALHSDSITSEDGIESKLKILAYEGVAPARYLDFFSIKNDRKIEGKYQPVARGFLKPQVDKMFEAVHTLEAVVAKGLRQNGEGGDGEETSRKDAA